VEKPKAVDANINPDPRDPEDQKDQREDANMEN